MKFGGLVALKDVTFDVYKGDLLAVIGPNGYRKNDAVQCHHRNLLSRGRQDRFQWSRHNVETSIRDCGHGDFSNVPEHKPV